MEKRLKVRLVANNAENSVGEVHSVKIKKWYIDKLLKHIPAECIANYKKIMIKIYQKKAPGGGMEEKRGNVCASELRSLE